MRYQQVLWCTEKGCKAGFIGEGTETARRIHIQEAHNLWGIGE